MTDEKTPKTGRVADCPSCNSPLRRSRAKGFKDTLMRLLGRAPYRCLDCGARYYRAK